MEWRYGFKAKIERFQIVLNSKKIQASNFL